MAIQSSGRVKLSEIATEFGGSGPHKLSEYYRGGSNVQETGLNTSAGIPQSGVIKLKTFYDTGNPTLTVLANTSATSYDFSVSLSSAKRSSHTSLILLYGAHSSSQGSQITFSITSHTVTTIAQVVNNDSNDGAATGIYTCNIGDVSSAAISSSGGVTNKDLIVLQYDNTPSLTSALDIDFSTSQTTMDLNMGTASFACMGWFNAFADDYTGNTVGSITSSGLTIINNNTGEGNLGYVQRLGSAGSKTFTLGGTPSRTIAPRSQSAASFNI